MAATAIPTPGAPPAGGAATVRAPAPHWPDVGLDVTALRRSGMRPTPFSQFILKIAARCNLDCDYCYVYNLADSAWRAAPRFMAPETVRAAAERIGRHAADHRLPLIRVCLHGGEPLLAGRERIDGVLRTLRAALPSETEIEFTVQTNGTLLDREWLEFFARREVGVAVSLDGDPATHDRHRRDRRGRPTRAAVERGLHLLASDAYRAHFAGLLAVVDLDADPGEFYRSLVSFDPPRMDLLLPHATWDTPPPHRDGAGPTPYADWLEVVFGLWFAASAAPTRIRLFESVIDLLLGGRPEGEAFGLAPLGYMIIDTDGAYRQSEALNAAYDGCSAIGLDVADSALDELLDVPGIVARQIGLEALGSQCRGCELVRVCGGGRYGHRYRSGTGFRNASVYCADLAKLIRSVGARLAESLAASSGGPAAAEPRC